MKNLFRTMLAAAALLTGTTLSAGTQDDLQNMIKGAFTIGKEMSMDALLVMYADDAEIIKPGSVRIAKDVFAPSIAMLDALKKAICLLLPRRFQPFRRKNFLQTMKQGSRQ